MSLPTPKEIKKIADACRKAGIKHFKSPEFEFTLTEELPISNYKKSKVLSSAASNNISDNTQITSEELTEEQLLFWSSGESSKDAEKIFNPGSF